jgi:hypothetical protein
MKEGLFPIVTSVILLSHGIKDIRNFGDHEWCSRVYGTILHMQLNFIVS